MKKTIKKSSGTRSKKQSMDHIKMQIMWTRLMGVVEGQAKSLIRTAFSATVSEAGDLSAAIFDRRGNMIAQAVTGTPGHVNSLAEAVKNFVKKFPVSVMAKGDHFITNDPWLSSGHLHDITVVTPTFRHGKLIALFACCCHQVDIGGLGQGPDATSVFEEGLFIPIMYLARKGVLNSDLMELIKENVRQPYEVEGDIHSYITSNDSGGRYLNQMLDEFPGIGFLQLADFILKVSRNSMIKKIRSLPKGTYYNSMTVDGYDRPVELCAKLVIKDDNIFVDLKGSSEASKFGINLVYNYTLAYSAYGVRAAIAPHIPNNTGSLEPIVVTAPEGSILNVRKPAPVCARHIIGQFLPDLMLGCLEKVVLDEIPAEGAAGIWGVQMRGGGELMDPARSKASSIPTYDLLFFNSGGTGARPASDGLSATGFPSGVRSLPVEAVENYAPVVIWKKEFRINSGGPGKWRGGLGQTVEVGTIDGSPFAVFAMFDRVENSARGRNGGGSGKPGKVQTANGKRLKSKGKQIISGGDHLVIHVPGGGGYGPPNERPFQLVWKDFKLGKILRKSMREDYGVIINRGGNIDEQKSHEERIALRRKYKKQALNPNACTS